MNKTINQGNKSSHELAATWYMMKARCENPKATSYYSYGARGIKVCDEWSNDFWKFVADMGERPEGHTLDRIDTFGNYEPGNCRWATRKQQGENHRPYPKGKNFVHLSYHGVVGNLRFWSKKTGIKSQTIRARIRNGWSVGEALGYENHIHNSIASPALINLTSNRQGLISLTAAAEDAGVPAWRVQSYVKRGMKLDDAVEKAIAFEPVFPRLYQDQHGVSLTLAEWSEKCGIPKDTLGQRIRSGMTLDTAMATPYTPRVRR